MARQPESLATNGTGSASLAPGIAGLANPATAAAASPGQVAGAGGPLLQAPAAQAPTLAPALPARLLSDSYVFHWELETFRADFFFTIAVALCLGIGLAAGHPAAGMIAASGAMTTGFGAKHNIDGSPLLTMIFVSLGIAFSTFVGMVAGHESGTLVIIAALFGFGYGMLSMREGGFSWVGQQCVVMLLVASAFPFTPLAAAERAALLFAGGVVQLLCSAVILRAFTQLGQHLRELAGYIRDEDTALRETYLSAVRSVQQRKLRGSPLPFALRLAVVLGFGCAIYTRLHFASGYWIPMTALLVMRPGIADTANRAVARTVGTLAGAVLSSIFLVYVHPAPVALAALAVLFTWLSYSLLNVNYALFSIALTSYIVFLLSLTNLPGIEIAHRRVVCTVTGGALALGVRLFVIRYRNMEDRRELGKLADAGHSS